MDFRLGQSVQFFAWLQRQTVYIPGKTEAASDHTYRRVWQRAPLFQPFRGIITGKRTLTEGDLEYGAYNERATLTECKYLEAYLIVTNLREKPYRVLTNDIQAVDL